MEAIFGICDCGVVSVSAAMEAYKRWVRRNKDYVHSLESLANVIEALHIM